MEISIYGTASISALSLSHISSGAGELEQTNSKPPLISVPILQIGSNNLYNEKELAWFCTVI